MSVTIEEALEHFEATEANIAKLDWLVRTACAEATKWPMPISHAINVSPADLQSGEVPRIVGESLARTGLRADRLELEITESAFVRGGQG